MKLYTKEDFLKAADFCEVSMIDAKYIIERIDEVTDPIELPSDMLCVNCDESKPTHNICMDCIMKVGKQNIELPSDEEISQESMDLFWGDGNSINHILQYKAFKRGAKWMRDKIQGDNL